MKKCKRPGCGNEFQIKRSNPHQVYCSRDCSPYGQLKDPKQNKKDRIHAKKHKEDESYIM